MITVPLPDDKGRTGDGRPKVHRFRSHWLELGRKLHDFRALRRDPGRDRRRGRALGGSVVSQWESGVAVPDGLRRERLTELLAGRLWPQLRASMIDGDGMPSRWNQWARWYRRASRERARRESVGAVVGAILDDLQSVDSPLGLRRCFGQRDGEWAHSVADRRGLGDACRADMRRIEDAAFGLRWLEIARGSHFDLRGSLVLQLPLAILDSATDDGHAVGESIP